MEKKKITLPIKVLIISIIIGLVFCLIGGIRQVLAAKTNETRRIEAKKKSQEKIDAANKRLAEIKKLYEDLEKEYDELYNKIEAKETEKSKIFQAEGFSDNYYKVDTEIKQIQKGKAKVQNQMDDLESEDESLRNDDYTVYYSLIKPMSYYIFYIIGGSVVGLGALGAFIIYLVKGKKTY